jgi:EpsI family protein
MVLTLVCHSYLSYNENIPLNKPLSTFPKKIGGWIGKEDTFDQRVYDVLGVDDSFLCNYTSPDGRHINLYIGFYRSQREGDLIHSPKNCMPGAGWNIIDTSLENLQMAGGETDRVRVIKLILQNGSQKQIVLYWFHSRGRIISSEYMQKVYLVIDSIARHRTDGSFVRLIAPVMSHTEDLTLKYLKDFAGQLVPVLNDYIPS